MLDAINFDF